MLARVIGATVLILAATASPAIAAKDRVFGGRTGADEPIVIQATSKGDKLRSAVVAWEARCEDGATFPLSAKVTPVVVTPGFENPGPTQLLMSRNARGRFSGTQLAGITLSNEESASLTVTLKGRLAKASATGSLSAEVRIVRNADGAPVTTCRTGSVSWRTSRDPGRIYGGVTSQYEPVVVRLDRARKRVADLLIGWDSSRCEPPGFYRLGDSLANFKLRNGRFASAFTQRFALNGGGERAYAYDISGAVTRTKATGKFSARLTEQAPDGSQAFCETGTVTWKAITG